MKNFINQFQTLNRFYACGLIIITLNLVGFYKNHTIPVARLGTLNGGIISAKDFKQHDILNAVIDNKDKEITCKVTGFNLVRVAKKQDPVEVIQHKGKFNKKSKALMEKATAGDIYYIDNVNARCPGDQENRKINSLVFKIK